MAHIKASTGNLNLSTIWIPTTTNSIVTAANDTVVGYLSKDGSKALVLGGTDFTYDTSGLSGGTITYVNYVNNNTQTSFEITVISYAVADVLPLLTGDDPQQLLNFLLSGDDVIIGGSGPDTLVGAGGDDWLTGGGGADKMYGGTGDDHYSVEEVGDKVIESNDPSNGGHDVVRCYINDYTLPNYVEDLELYGPEAHTGTGNALANSIGGTQYDNALFGLAGADFLYGWFGNDTLDGGTGIDTLAGSKGDDTYIVDNGLDKVEEYSGEGTDTVLASVSYKLSANIENLTLTGAKNISGTGNTSDNTLYGNDANNILDGKAGADTLSGGAGNDVYIVDDVGDVVIESDNAGNDTVKSSVDFTLGTNLEKLVLTGGANTGTGNDANNIILGNASANSLSGLGGNDKLTGNGGEDSLMGGGGNDTLSGNAGDDTLIGGDGDDRLAGGNGADVFVFDSLTGSDTVTAFVRGADTLQLDHTVFTALSQGALTADAFFKGTGLTAATAAQDASDHLIYDKGAGALYYDADGAGGEDAIQIATIGTGSNHPAGLTESDFFII